MRPTTVAVFVATHPAAYVYAVRQVLWRCSLPVVVGVLYPDDGPRFDEAFADEVDALQVRRVSWCQVGSISELINSTYARTGGNVIVVDDAVSLPPDPFGPALALVGDDARVATVSFLSNAADWLSFPTRNLPTGRSPEGHDEISITRLLRETDPGAVAAPVPYAHGAVVVIAAPALGAVGEFVAPASARFDVAIADFSARARARGFVDLCDTSTYIARTSDVSVWPVDHRLTDDDMGWLLHRHQSLVHHFPMERSSGDSAFACAHQAARVKSQGLHVLVDGSCFGPNEVGTQVATAEMLRALRERDDIARISVALPGAMPPYAATALVHPKIDARHCGATDLVSTFGIADVAYRPYQPVPGWDAGAWRGAAVRFAVSILDLIAFHNGGYFSSSADWLQYRASMEAVARQADLITVIAADVADQIERHGLPVEAARLAILPLGTNHLRADDHAQPPAELLARGFGSSRFALCLGVNYTHKNRDLAMRAHALVRAAGHDLVLVMVGAAVPHGTTRLAEQLAAPRLRGPADNALYMIPEVTSAERTWLLRHAELVWYPTSAEGFGLVPFEAAMLSTPTVSVGFGPLLELAHAQTWRRREEPAEDVLAALRTVSNGRSRLAAMLRFGLDGTAEQRSFEEVGALMAMPVEEVESRVGAVLSATSGLEAAGPDLGVDVPVFARGWTAEELADAALALLGDPDLARRHVEVIVRAAETYTWDRHAEGLTREFRSILARPRR